MVKIATVYAHFQKKREIMSRFDALW